MGEAPHSVSTALTSVKRVILLWLPEVYVNYAAFKHHRQGSWIPLVTSTGSWPLVHLRDAPLGPLHFQAAVHPLARRRGGGRTVRPDPGDS